MIISRKAAFGKAVVLVGIASCGGDAAELETRSREGAAATVERPATESAAGAVAVLPGPLPPDPCSILTADRAAEVLQGEVTQRPAAGGACSYLAAGAGSVRLLLVPYPLDQVDSRRVERSTLAATFGQAAGLITPPSYHGDVAGQPAFGAENDRASVLFVPSGVMTSAAVSDRPIAEVVVQVSLTNDRLHADRLEALTGIAGEAVRALRRQATTGE